MYAGGFYPYETLEEYWAYWSRYIQLNRYTPAPKPVYDRLLELVANKDYFVLTTNVDHQFQKAGFDKQRLFYTQGDYGLWQCSRPCHDKTYDNEGIVQKMVDQQKNRRVPTELIPRCPVCGRPMTMNLRCDDRFVQDEGWYAAQARYAAYLREHQKARTLYWELGVGGNTPGIIQYPFRRLTLLNPKAVYACVNLEETAISRGIARALPCHKGRYRRGLKPSEGIAVFYGTTSCKKRRGIKPNAVRKRTQTVRLSKSEITPPIFRNRRGLFHKMCFTWV